MSNHRLILERLHEPLAILESKLFSIEKEVGMRLRHGLPLSDNGVMPMDRKMPMDMPEEQNSKIGFLKIFDSLVAKNGAGASGFTSYESLYNQTKSLLKSGIEKLVVYGDTPGGEVAGLFAFTDFLYSLPAKYNVETIAFTDGMMTSAGYAIMAACKKKYATKSATLGSIAVVASLVSTLRSDQEEGLDFTIIRSKDKKAIYNPHEAISEEVVAKMQKRLAALDNIFNENISKYNPKLSIENIIAMQGDCFLAEEALQLNLIDGLVSSLDELLINQTQTRGISMASPTLEELQVENSSLKTQIISLESALAESKKEGAKEERARVTGILESAKVFGIDQTFSMKLIEKGQQVEDAKILFELDATRRGFEKSIDTSGQTAFVPKIPEKVNDLDDPFAFVKYIDQATQSFGKGAN